MSSEFKPSKLYWKMALYEGDNVLITTQQGESFVAYVDTLLDSVENEDGEGFILDDVYPNGGPDFVLLKDIKEIKSI